MRVWIDYMERVRRPYLTDTHDDVHIRIELDPLRKHGGLAEYHRTKDTAQSAHSWDAEGRRRTYRSHLEPAHMKRLLLSSTRRLDLDVIRRPPALPRRSLLRSEPRARELAVRVQIRKVGVGLSSEWCKARNLVTQFARPVVRPKVVQHADEYFVHLLGGTPKAIHSHSSVLSQDRRAEN